MKIVIQLLFCFIVLVLFNYANAQDFMQKPRVTTLTHPSNNCILTPLGQKNLNKRIGSPNNTQSTHSVLNSDGYYSTYPLAPTGYYRYERAVYLITAAEMAAAGVLDSSNFTQIGFFNYQLQTASTIGTFRIYFQNTNDVVNNKVSSWTTDISTMTLADSSADTLVAYNLVHTLSKPNAFKYTGGGIYIAWEYSGATTTYSNQSYPMINSALTTRYSATKTVLGDVSSSASGRPATLLGYYVPYDAHLCGVYALALLPAGQVNSIQAAIANTGDNSFTSIPCTLTVAGCNSFSNISHLTNLPAGYWSPMWFNPYSPSVIGVDSIKITLPSDSYTNDKTMTIYQLVNNTNTMAYSDGTTNYTNAIGDPGVNSEYILSSMFYFQGNVAINSARIFIYEGTGHTVSAIVNDKSGAVLAQSALHTIVAADSNNYVTFTFPSPPVINNDSVYVGLDVAPSSATFTPLGLQSEDWMRTGAFFIKDANGFSDLAGNNYGKFMIEAKFTPILPVELYSFTSNVSKGKVDLSWSTATEVNNNGFQIEKMCAGEGLWSEIAFIKGAGNSNITKHYSYSDYVIKNGVYYYRLKQIDNNGKFNYSSLITVDVNTPLTFSLSQNYPNPFNPSTTINYSVPKAGNIKLTVYNTLGARVDVIVDEYKTAGNYSVLFNAANLASGIYLYKLEFGSFSQTKKFILMK